MGSTDLLQKKQITLQSEGWHLDDGSVYRMDALEFLTGIPGGVADLVFIDPPFNLGKKYGNRKSEDDQIPKNKYTSFLLDTLAQSVRILAEGGSLFVYHLPEWSIQLAGFLQQRLSFRHWIAISMKNGFARGEFLYPAHYSLLYFTKGEPAHFERPKLPLEKCRHCGKNIKDYGGYLDHVKDGVNASDVWDDLSPVRHSKYKNRVANELPIEMLRRIVTISGFPGGLLVDPFVGSGTSLVAAREVCMSFLANDRELSCCRVALERMNDDETHCL